MGISSSGADVTLGHDRIPSMRRIAIILALLLLTLPASAQRRRAAGAGSVTILDIGGLFSLTGDGSTLGIASAAALELAERDINLEFDALRVPYRVTTSIADTRLVPAIAAAKFDELTTRGVAIVIGGQSSAEAAAMREMATARNVLIISQGSTASSLAIDDHLFRLAPNDKVEGEAQAAVMRADAFDTMLPIWRDDAGNRGLYESTKLFFEAAGGTSVTGVAYHPATTDFTAIVAELGTKLRALKNERPNAKIAIYLASFEEAIAIFHLARLDADLASVRWYAGDGVTQSQAILDDATAAQFATTVQLTAPNVGLDESLRSRWEPIRNEIAATVGFTPDTFALSAYDAAWVAALSAVEVQFRRENLRDSFVRNVQRYWGITGPTALDAFGDRRLASFDFWTVRETDGQRSWVRTSQYTGGRVVR